MRSDIRRLLVTAVAAGSMAMGPAALAHEGPHPPPGDEAAAPAPEHGHGDAGAPEGGHSHGDEGAEPVEYDIVQGAFFPASDEHRAATGSAKLGRADGQTRLWVEVSGLAPDALYVAHLHEGSCSAHDAHYRDDPDGEAGPPNELWASGDPADPKAGMRSDAGGRVVGGGTAEWKARRSARAVMFHDASGAMLACADLT